MYAILYIILIMDIDILIGLYNSFLGIVLSDAAIIANLSIVCILGVLGLGS